MRAYVPACDKNFVSGLIIGVTSVSYLKFNIFMREPIGYELCKEPQRANTSSCLFAEKCDNQKTSRFEAIFFSNKVKIGNDK